MLAITLRRPREARPFLQLGKGAVNDDTDVVFTSHPFASVGLRNGLIHVRESFESEPSRSMAFNTCGIACHSELSEGSD